MGLGKVSADQECNNCKQQSISKASAPAKAYTVLCRRLRLSNSWLPKRHASLHPASIKLTAFGDSCKAEQSSQTHIVSPTLLTIPKVSSYNCAKRCCFVQPRSAHTLHAPVEDTIDNSGGVWGFVACAALRNTNIY